MNGDKEDSKKISTVNQMKIYGLSFGCVQCSYHCERYLSVFLA